MRPPSSRRLSGWRVEATHEIQQSGLARSRWSHEREEVALWNLEGDALEHVNAFATPGEVLVDVTNFHELLVHCVGLPLQRDDPRAASKRRGR